MTITPLYLGTFSVGLDKLFHRIGKDDAPAKGALKLSINAFLIQYEDRKIIIDPGLGEFGEGTRLQDLRDQLLLSGLDETDITDVICSHLHYDHIGGLAHRESGYWELSFPEARIWVCEREWDKALGMTLYYDEEKTAFLAFLNARANLNFLAEQDQPFKGIQTRTIGGHTEFSQLILGDHEGTSFLMAGDVLASRSHVNRKFAAKYDFDPKRASDLRTELSELAYKEKRHILAFHSNSNPIFYLSDYSTENGYTLSEQRRD